MARLSPALLALSVALAALGAAHAQGACPVTAAQVAEVDLSAAVQACQPGVPAAQLCESCICALVEAFTPAIAAAGITADQAAGVSEDQASQLLTACAGVLLGPLRSAGIGISTLLQLQSCQTSGVTPSCLAGTAADGAPTAGALTAQPAQPAAGVAPVTPLPAPAKTATVATATTAATAAVAPAETVVAEAQPVQAVPLTFFAGFFWKKFFGGIGSYATLG